MDLRCPRCGEPVRAERSTRGAQGPVRSDPVVDLWVRCAGCGLRVDASGIGDVDAEMDLARKVRNYDATRQIRVPAQRGPRRRR